MAWHAPRWVLPAVLVLCCAQPAAQTAAQTIETLTEDSSYSYLHNGRVSGAAARIVEAVLQEAGLLDYHMGLYPWARAYDRALREPDMLIYPIMRTPGRESSFKWVGQLDLVMPSFYKLAEAPGIDVASLEDAKHYRVGVVRDDTREKFLQEQGFTRLVVAPNNLDNFNRLLGGQVQLVPMPERDARKLCQDAHIPYETLEKTYTLDALNSAVYMAFSRATDDEVVHRARAAFARLSSAGVIQRILQEQP